MSRQASLTAFEPATPAATIAQIQRVAADAVREQGVGLNG